MEARLKVFLLVAQGLGQEPEEDMAASTQGREQALLSIMEGTD